MQRRRIRCIMFAGIVMVVGAWASWSMSADESSWVGATTCKKCHLQAYQVWAESAHAGSESDLAGGSQTDPKCTQCHGLSGSKKRGVQCESCHGSGKYYAERYVMKDQVLVRMVGLVEVTEKVCRRCHVDTAPNIQPYEHEQMWRLISHGRESKPGTEPTEKTH